MLEFRAAFRPLHHGSRIGEHVVEQPTPGPGQSIGCFPAFADGEAGVVLPFGDVSATPLHEIEGKFLAQGPPRFAFGQFGQGREFRLQQAQQVVEGRVVAGMGRGGEKHHAAAGFACGKALEQLIALVPRVRVGPHAGMRLVDDDEVRAGAQKIVAPPVRFDVIEGYDREEIGVEHRFVRAESPLQAGSRSRADHLGVEAELFGELLLPLFAQVRRADDGQPLDFSPVEQFSRNQARLDGFANAYVVGDEQAHRILFHRHQQGHELIGSRLDVQVPETPKGTGAGAQFQAQRIAQ